MKPIIGITTGCPCGIGPEIVEKAVADPRVKEICTPRIFGAVAAELALPLGKASFAATGRAAIGRAAAGRAATGRAATGRAATGRAATGRASSAATAATECGRISMAAVDGAVRAVMSGEVAAIVTAPINKAHWKAAGSPFPGHTEYLAHVSGAKSVAMMMHSPRLKVSLVTTHARIADVPGLLTIEKICEVAQLTHNWFQQCHRTIAPSHHRTNLAICSLNPHAGDGGLFGDEEGRIIVPAIQRLQAAGLNVSGPWPADTVFWKAMNGEFDAVVAMYHDQALAAIKTLDFRRTVNVTLGLPFIRTSPDHGTAEDIAGKGVADHANMVAAIELAVGMARGGL